MPRISPPTITASAIWAYGTRTLTGITGTPRIDLTGADEALTPSRIWAAPTRELTQAQFPFWSAIIEQSAASLSVPAAGTAYVNIQPPAGETWLLLSLDAYITPREEAQVVTYEDYDGTTRRPHSGQYRDPTASPFLSRVPAISKILTNALYGSVKFINAAATAKTAYYGYAGLKLSKPLKRITRAVDPPRWRRKPTEFPVPTELEPLSKYVCDLYDTTEERYRQAIILEEDMPLAKDEKGNIVERLTVIVYSDDFLANLTAIKADPVKTGYKKYLDKWAEEGIVL